MLHQKEVEYELEIQKANTAKEDLDAKSDLADEIRYLYSYMAQGTYCIVAKHGERRVDLTLEEAQVILNRLENDYKNFDLKEQDNAL